MNMPEMNSTYIYDGQCEYCKSDPKSHSFHIDIPLSSISDKYKVYNTIISEAKLYNRPDTIIHHIEKEPHITKELTWEWMINFSYCELKHYMAMNTIIELSRWINREKENKCKNLKKIYLFGSNSMLLYPLVGLSKLFLPSNIDVVIL